MIPDAERLAVAWAKSVSEISAAFNSQIATRLPADWSGVFLRVFLIDTRTILEDSPDLSVPVLQWDAYAQTDTPSPNYAGASDAIRIVHAHMMEDVPYIDNEEGGVLSFGRPIGPRRIEETDTRWARYMLEVPVAVATVAGA